jgi:hypothetical protein
LTLTPSIGSILAQWTYSDPHVKGLRQLQLDQVELRASATNDYSTAVKVAEGKNSARYDGLIEGATYYFWIVPRGNWASATNPKTGMSWAAEGRGYGDRYPSSDGIKATAGFAAGATHALINGKLSVSVAANTLTIAVKTVSGDDPSATNPVFVAFAQSDGSYLVRSITAALAVTISSGSTLGLSANTAFNIWLLLIDDAGTVRIGAIVCTTSTTFFALDESRSVSSTAEGGSGGADSAGVVYTSSAVTSKQFRIAGFATWNAGLATPGAWNTNPDQVTLYGPGVKKPGETVQIVENFSSAVQTGTTKIPLDDTIPQSTEGTQFFSTSITPASAANYISHDVRLVLATDLGNSLIVALFRGAESSALAADATMLTSTAVGPKYRHVAGGTTALTFSVRGGGDTATSPTKWTLNGDASGNRLLGGGLFSGHRITELAG